ncbi:MAG: hypothetical protein ABI968_08420 [Acidobacteriota bacterium]
MKRLLLLLIVAGIIAYLIKTQGVLHTAAPASERGAPIDRAHAAAGADDARAAAGDAVARESEQSGGGAVTENMTPDQVRALIGSPDDVATSTTGSGATRETWTYKNVGKSVVFENGVVISVQ